MNFIEKTRKDKNIFIIIRLLAILLIFPQLFLITLILLDVQYLKDLSVIKTIVNLMVSVPERAFLISSIMSTILFIILIFAHRKILDIVLVIVALIISIGLYSLMLDLPNPEPGFSRDSGVQASINKVTLRVEEFIEINGRLPNDSELIQIYDSYIDCGGLGEGLCKRKQCNGNDYVCTFKMESRPLISKVIAEDEEKEACDYSGWRGNGKYNCFYHYFGELSSAGNKPHFRIAAKAYASYQNTENIVFLYDNLIGNIVECPSDKIEDAAYADVLDGEPCF